MIASLRAFQEKLRRDKTTAKAELKKVFFANAEDRKM